MRRRVVVTGMGAVTPSGITVDELWNNVVMGKSSCRTIDRFDTDDLVTNYACMIPTHWDPYRVTPEKQHRIYDRFMIFAFDAVDQAIQDSGITINPTRTGLAIGSGVGGLETYLNASAGLLEKGGKRFSPFWLPSALINLANGHLSIKYNIQGPSISNASACATSANTIGDAFRYIQHGQADVMIAGGSEAAVNRLGLAGFGSMRALSTGFKDIPEQASRPWDKDRDGFVMGEGAGALVLEEYNHALERGARIYAEVLGYGQSMDANHYTSPREDGEGGVRAMELAMIEADRDCLHMDYINAHGTSTPLGDDAELRAIETLFADLVPVSSTKSMTGHLLGAAGAVESIITIKAMQSNTVPPTINLENRSYESTVELPTCHKHVSINTAMSNSFAFGGMNAALIFGKI